MARAAALVGPTASGKSSLAVAVAVELGAEIISCDSMAVYRGFDIGTAKPSPRERKRVRHHLIDVVDADEPFSAALWAARAEAALDEIAGRGKAALVVGGTGLYLRALRWGLVDAPPRDEALRARLSDEERDHPGTLHARLTTIDPLTATRIAPRDLVRLIRALEVHALTGQPISAHYAAQTRTVRRALPLIVLDAPPPLLDERIVARTTRMLADGLVNETRTLREKHPGSRLLEAVGYRQASEFLDGTLSEAALAPAITRSTRQYARRQRTWFRAEPDGDWLDATAAATRLRTLLH